MDFIQIDLKHRIVLILLSHFSDSVFVLNGYTL